MEKYAVPNLTGKDSVCPKHQVIKKESIPGEKTASTDHGTCITCRNEKKDGLNTKRD